MFHSIQTIVLSFLFLFSSLTPTAGIDIFDAAREGDLTTIAAYVREGGNVNVVNSGSYTPFILATYHGHDAAGAELMKAGADVCAVDQRGSNAYMGVAFKGYLHTAQWLFDNTDCDINHQNGAGQTALMMASLFGHEDMVKLFIQRGADPTIVDDQGNTAESLAAGQGLGKIIQIIKFNTQ